jgi:hypothetical protein
MVINQGDICWIDLGDPSFLFTQHSLLVTHHSFEPRFAQGGKVSLCYRRVFEGEPLLLSSLDLPSKSQ